MLEVREARYFVAVAEELHFGRAAERLHMSQPPLSQAIKALEHRLGAALLTRSTRAVALTSAGAVLLQHCRQLLNGAEAAETAVRQAAGGQLGRLRIGAVASAFFDPLPSVLASFRQQHPRVEVEMHELDTHVAVQSLREHAIDVALARQLATPQGMRRRTLSSETFVLALPGDWAPGSKEPVDLTSVAELPWIWLPRHLSPDYHDQVVACCRANGFSPPATHTAHSIASQLAMVACGIGVAVVPASAAHHATAPLADIRFLPFRGSAIIKLAAVWPATTNNRCVEEFLEAAETAAANRS